MTFLIDIPSSMLQKPLSRSLARHTNIKALEYAIELRIGHTESLVLCKHFSSKLDDVDSVSHKDRASSPRRWLVDSMSLQTVA